MLTFKPHNITEKFLSVLNDRTRDVIKKRYGLAGDGVTYTLESIGAVYGITRERVRQIENHGVQTIQKSPLYKEHHHIFNEIENLVRQLGVIVDEEHLLETIAPKKEHRNHVFLLLNVGKQFSRAKEDRYFTDRWHVDGDVATSVEDVLTALVNAIDADELVSEQELLNRLKSQAIKISDEHHNTENFLRWLRISKRLGKNPLGEWGSVDSSNVRTKGVRDYAYLIVKRHGSPMHFREVAEAIERTFDRSAHIATTHNELIKDKRFVLVGRGLYALTEWGYTPGVVKDVILSILRQNGPMTRAEIIDLVRKERYVKDNTILVNLQDNVLFVRKNDGRYAATDM